MIRNYKTTPRNFSKQSRDYQLLGHLFDSSFNNAKQAIDSFDPTSRNWIDDRFLDLGCRTIGFFNKQSYDASILNKVIKTFKYLVKHKGELKAIKEATNMILQSQGINEEPTLIMPKGEHNIDIYLPSETKNLRLLEEIFDYILPIGYTYTIRETDLLKSEYENKLYLKNNITKVNKYSDLELSKFHYLNAEGKFVYEDLKNISRYYISDGAGGVAYDSEGIPMVYPVTEDGKIIIGYDGEGNPITIEPTSDYIPVYSDRDVEAVPSVNKSVVYTKTENNKKGVKKNGKKEKRSK